MIGITILNEETLKILSTFKQYGRVWLARGSAAFNVIFTDERRKVLLTLLLEYNPRDANAILLEDE
ncbi:hypothetical protein ACTXT7_003002 [Hymenolepis weldensis]